MDFTDLHDTLPPNLQPNLAKAQLEYGCDALEGWHSGLN